jgi:chromosomal replication initiator protein
MNDPTVWNSILLALEKRINHESFTTWFRPISFIDMTAQQIKLRIPDRVFEDWILNNYRDVLDEAIDEAGVPHMAFSFEIGQEMQKTEVRHQAPFAAKAEVAVRSEAAAAAAASQSVQVEPVVAAARSVDTEHSDLPINVGSCNQFAHAAALAVAGSPSRTYNPLYLYGGVGLGKTHLMCAIGHKIKEQNRHLRLSYISAEKFMNELINAIRYDQTMTFREKYRSIDVLLIDDIQFMAGKERTQEEFFHTFNALYDGQKQIVISSDCPV